MVDILYLGYFGSIVRADTDASSDADVLCVLNSKEEVSKVELRQLADPKVIGSRYVDLSIYSYERFKEMWVEGHLFAWHIFFESKPFRGYDEFISGLGTPGEYINAVIDIARLRELLIDVTYSLNKSIVSKVYEAGLIYVAARNIGISASWYSDSGLNFSRLAPCSLKLCGRPITFPVESEAYARLCAARHAAMRGENSPDFDILELRAICDKVLNWSDRVLKEIEALS
uniref:Putative nucleotidyltransferase n=1 Tax=Pseudomonas sp. GLE121 TaxID=1329969 RepID=R4L162_9PSED|nr:nucleotidyltransferase [Pseudomonas sp. GLE121]AGL12834.1 putative nucleotidyltransferase [Pseudomonas sp. GLE121]